jgi:hypothetical protein
MHKSQPIDAPVEVEANLADGKVNPQSVTWLGQQYQVIGVGRQWQAENGTHVLIELHDQSRMEVCLGQNLRWQLCRYWPATAVA